MSRLVSSTEAEISHLEPGISRARDGEWAELFAVASDAAIVACRVHPLHPLPGPRILVSPI